VNKKTPPGLSIAVGSLVCLVPIDVRSCAAWRQHNAVCAGRSETNA